MQEEPERPLSRPQISCFCPAGSRLAPSHSAVSPFDRFPVCFPKECRRLFGLRRSVRKSRFLFKRNAARAVTIPMVRKTGPASVSRREAEIPAAEAETAGAPWITASQLKAKPWPNKFMAIAARSGERPAFKVTGSRTAPTRATAGEGHKNSETKKHENSQRPPGG